jgi:hypothetical protein
MAKLPFEFCEVAFEVREALDEGRMVDAKRIVIERLQAGYHSQPFADVIAEMLGAERRAGTKGRKARKYPPQWLEIGYDFRQLRDSGITHEEARRQLAKKWERSSRSIETTRAFFEKSDEVLFKFWQRSYRNNNNEQD